MDAWMLTKVNPCLLFFWQINYKREKDLFSDNYYRENDYIEKLYSCSMQDLSKGGLTSAFYTDSYLLH